MIMRLTGILLVVGLLAACNPAQETDTLPTLAQFPTDAPTRAVTDVVQALQPTLPPTASATATVTWTVTPSTTPTITVTPSLTITDTPSPTATNTPPAPTVAPEDRPLLAFALTAAAATVLPDDFAVPDSGGPNFIPASPTSGLPPGLQPTSVSVPGQGCPVLPAGGFGAVFTGNPDIAMQIGCPQGNPPTVRSVAAASQPFQNGVMIWLDGRICALYSLTDTYECFVDTFQEEVDPETSDETAPDGLFAPVRGFLKVWSTNVAVRDRLGWGLTTETGTQATVQRFDSGQMIWLPARPDILVLIGDNAGVWRSVTGQF